MTQAQPKKTASNDNVTSSPTDDMSCCEGASRNGSHSVDAEAWAQLVYQDLLCYLIAPRPAGSKPSIERALMRIQRTLENHCGDHWQPA